MSVCWYKYLHLKSSRWAYRHPKRLWGPGPNTQWFSSVQFRAILLVQNKQNKNDSLGSAHKLTLRLRRLSKLSRSELALRCKTVKQNISINKRADCADPATSPPSNHHALPSDRPERRGSLGRVILCGILLVSLLACVRACVRACVCVCVCARVCKSEGIACRLEMK